MAKNTKSDIGLVVASKEEAVWVEIRQSAKEKLNELFKQKLFTDATLEIANDKLKEYDKKVKKIPGYIA